MHPGGRISRISLHDEFLRQINRKKFSTVLTFCREVLIQSSVSENSAFQHLFREILVLQAQPIKRPENVRFPERAFRRI